MSQKSETIFLEETSQLVEAGYIGSRSEENFIVAGEIPVVSGSDAELR